MRRCKYCELISIQGIVCHEHGCPNAAAIWNGEAWIQQRECRECGCVVDRDDPCCAEEVVA